MWRDFFYWCDEGMSLAIREDIDGHRKAYQEMLAENDQLGIDE